MEECPFTHPSLVLFSFSLLATAIETAFTTVDEGGFSPKRSGSCGNEQAIAYR